jgi:hypothetical protein
MIVLVPAFLIRSRAIERTASGRKRILRTTWQQQDPRKVNREYVVD